MPKRGQNEGSIYQRADGRWVAVVNLGYQDGKRKRKYFYGDTRRAVQQQLTRALRDQQQGLPVAPERQTLKQFLTAWLANAVKPTVRPRTYTSYEQIVRLHLVPSLGHLLLSQLSPQHVQALLQAKRAAGLSPRTVQYIRVVLRRALGQALKWGLVARNVATLVDSPRVPQREVAALAPAQARALLEAARGDRLEALYSVALAVGLRQGEALGLHWQDVDLDAGTLTVRRQLQRINGRLVLVEPKTARSRRTITLPASIVRALRAHQQRQRDEQAQAGERWQESGLVFTTATGRPLHGKTVLRSFRHVLTRAGLPPMRFHDLRHACAGLLLAQGVSARVIMETLGHSTISTTMNIYAHVLPQLQQEAAARMDALLTDTDADADDCGDADDGADTDDRTAADE